MSTLVFNSPLSSVPSTHARIILTFVLVSGRFQGFLSRFTPIVRQVANTQFSISAFRFILIPYLFSTSVLVIGLGLSGYDNLDLRSSLPTPCLKTRRNNVFPIGVVISLL